MAQQAWESIASFVIHVEWEHIHQGVEVTTTYHAFVSRLGIIMQYLLDNIQVNKRANGGVVSHW